MSNTLAQHPGTYWNRLARHASALIEIVDLPHFSAVCHCDDTINRFDAAITGMQQSLSAINGGPQLENQADWRTDPARTHYRLDYETRLMVHIVRNRVRHNLMTASDAAHVLEDRGISQAGIARLLSEFRMTEAA